MAINLFPLLLLGGGAVAIMAAGKKKKKTAEESEKKEPLVIEPKRPPREVPKPSIECATRIDASIRFDIIKHIKATGRPAIIAGSCNGNGFNMVYDKVCKEYSDGIDFVLARLEDASNPGDMREGAEMCKALNNGAFILVGRPQEQTYMMPGGTSPIHAQGVMLFDFEDIPGLRFDPTKAEARIVIAKALDFAKGATHPAARFIPYNIGESGRP